MEGSQKLQKEEREGTERKEEEKGSRGEGKLDREGRGGKLWEGARPGVRSRGLSWGQQSLHQ